MGKTAGPLASGFCTGQGTPAIGHGDNSRGAAAPLHCRIKGGLGIGEGGHEQAPYGLVRPVGHQIDIRTLFHQGDGGCFVAAQNEILPQPLNDGARALRLAEPLLESGFSKAFLGSAHQYDHAAVLHGMLGVVQGFLQLVEVGVLGCAALAHQYNVGPGGNGLEVELF